jgi:hypothetical protein
MMNKLHERSYSKFPFHVSICFSERWTFSIYSQSYKNWRRLIAGVKEALLQDAGTIVSINNIPETSEDISPYATFQLSGPGGDPHNTLLHSFMYHEQAMTEGCASPPPPAGVSMNYLTGLILTVSLCNKHKHTFSWHGCTCSYVFQPCLSSGG